MLAKYFRTNRRGAACLFFISRFIGKLSARGASRVGVSILSYFQPSAPWNNQLEYDYRWFFIFDIQFLAKASSFLSIKYASIPIAWHIAEQLTFHSITLNSLSNTNNLTIIAQITAWRTRKWNFIIIEFPLIRACGCAICFSLLRCFCWHPWPILLRHLGRSQVAEWLGFLAFHLRADQFVHCTNRLEIDFHYAVHCMWVMCDSNLHALPALSLHMAFD